MPVVDRDLEKMQKDLETIANLTQGTEETVVYMKDSATSAQKNAGPGNKFNLICLVYLCVLLIMNMAR